MVKHAHDIACPSHHRNHRGTLQHVSTKSLYICRSHSFHPPSKPKKKLWDPTIQTFLSGFWFPPCTSLSICIQVYICARIVDIHVYTVCLSACEKTSLSEPIMLSILHFLERNQVTGDRHSAQVLHFSRDLCFKHSEVLSCVSFLRRVLSVL